MFAQFWLLLTAWSSLDSWIVVTAALTAVACSLPGLWLVLRRQSMMGDALSHTALLGVILSMLTVTAVKALGWISEGQFAVGMQLALIIGAVLMGIVTTVLPSGCRGWPMSMAVLLWESCLRACLRSVWS